MKIPPLTGEQREEIARRLEVLFEEVVNAPVEGYRCGTVSCEDVNDMVRNFYDAASYTMPQPERAKLRAHLVAHATMNMGYVIAQMEREGWFDAAKGEEK